MTEPKKMDPSLTREPAPFRPLSEKVLRLGGLAEQAIDRSVQSLVDRDSDLGAEVIAADHAIDALELEVDQLCMTLLARYQPLAGDLRFITTAMKIAPDIERIADHAVNISQRAIELNEEPPLPPLVDMPLMASHARRMVRGALDAFVRRDAESARDVIALDDELDLKLENVFRVLLSHMLEEPKTTRRALRLVFVAKYFERIGDQATNICEQVVYMSEAKVIKHQGREDS